MPRTFSVKDFFEFQHYKERTPPWIKLHNALLDDYEFGRLPDAAKAHLMAIWLLASRYDNVIPYDARWVAGKISATAPVDLDLLAEAGFIIVSPLATTAENPDQLLLLAPGKQNACLEGETEGETEGEAEGEADAVGGRAQAPVPRVRKPAPEYDGKNWQACGHAAIGIAAGFQLPAEWGEYAMTQGMTAEAILRLEADFVNYWRNVAPASKNKRSVKGWLRTWTNNVQREIRRK